MSSDAFIKCFRCSLYFNEDDRIPLNLKCGDTLCKKCIDEIVSNRETKCPICNKENKLNKSKISKLPQNKQILIALQEKFADNEEEMREYDFDNQTSSISSSYYYEKCSKHSEKRIEYFCRDCTMVVCVVCIYSHHNGHHLSVLEDMGTIIKQNINDFSKMLKNVSKINEENFQTVQTKYVDIKELKEQQMKIVEKSFDEIKNILEEKKLEILNTFNL